MPQREAREGERDDRGGSNQARQTAPDTLLRGGLADVDGEPGDLTVRVGTAKDDRFERHGNDLHMIFRVDLVEALAGFDKAFTPLTATRCAEGRDHHPGARGDDRQGGHACTINTKVREPRRDVPSGLSQEAHEKQKRGQEALRGNALILSSRGSQKIFFIFEKGTRFVHKGYVHLRFNPAPSRSPSCRVNSGVRHCS